MTEKLGTSPIQWLKGQLKTQGAIQRELMEAIQKRSVSPYAYVKPFIKAAAGVGEPPVGTTPYKVVYTRGKMRLLHYESPNRKYLTPILFVYSLINRYYILDFLPGRSLIDYMRHQGFDVYAVDWGVPGDAEAKLGWDDYLGGTLVNAVRWAKRTSGAPDVTLYGYCMGGTMALAYAALYPEGIRNFVAQAVPVDFHQGGIFTEWTKPSRFNVDAMVDAFGNVPVEMMESGFSMMAPVQRATKWLEVFKKVDDPAFVTTFLGMEHWASDNIPFPGGVYRQYIKDCYQQNNFCQGKMVVGGTRVDLSHIKCPVLNVLANKDTIAPAESSLPLMDLISSTDKEVKQFETGHIGLSTSSKGPKVVWPQIAGWISKRSELLPEEIHTADDAVGGDFSADTDEAATELLDDIADEMAATPLPRTEPPHSPQG